MDILMKFSASLEAIDIMEQCNGFLAMSTYIQNTDNEIVIEKMMELVASFCDNPEVKEVRDNGLIHLQMIVGFSSFIEFGF
jgi:hypothetical protein